MNKTKSFKLKSKILLLIIIFPLLLSSVLFLSSNPVLAQNNKIPQAINFKPQVQLPIPPFNSTSVPVGEYVAKQGIMKSDLLAKYIKALYDYGLMIGGILAAVVLMGGGLMWLLSAGNDSRVAQAKELITGSVVGLIILFGSWVILDTINPNLTELSTINTQVIKKEKPASLGCCLNTETNEATNTTKIDCGQSNLFYPNELVNPKTNKCELAGCCYQVYYGLTDSTLCKRTVQSACNNGKNYNGSYGEIYFYANQECSSLSECAGAK